MTIAGRTALLMLAPGLLGITLSTVAAATVEVTAELARCAALEATDARLACYDTLAGRPVGGNVPSPDRATATVTPAVASSLAPTTAAPAPADADRHFGLSAAQQHTAPQGPQAIQARIAQITVDQLRRSYVILDNGQTWASIEGEVILDSGELVTIKRAALGSFMLVSAQSKRSYRVRRVR